MPLKILHIVIDEIFIDDTIELCHDICAVNKFVTFTQEYPYKYIHRYPSEIKSILKTELIPLLLNEDFQMVAFHTLDSSLYELVLQIPPQIKVLWLAWGYDLYCITPPIINLPLLKPKTRCFVNNGVEQLSLEKRIKRWVKGIYYYPQQRKIQLKHKKNDNQIKTIQNNVLSRIDYMSVVLPSEYDVLAQNPFFHAQYFPWQYCDKSSNSFLYNPFHITDCADMILLGNSATETNNHIDVYRLLRKRGIYNTCVIPLSYGDAYYQSLLQTYFCENESVQLLTEFMSLEQYEQILHQCKIAVFGHIRQQAIGNIIRCMAQGTKVYFYKDSMAYKYLIKEGYVVYSIENDLTFNHIATPLSDEDWKKNIDKLRKWFSYDCVVKRINNMIENEF